MVLHICSDFSKQRIYHYLISALNKNAISQKVYVPVRSKAELNQNMDTTLKNVHYYFRYILTPIMKVRYFHKIKTVFKDIKTQIDFKAVRCVHAHFLFSDGGVAYKIKKNFGIDYIVAVRNTDLNIFFKYGFHLRWYGVKILRNARSIILITPSYKHRLLAYVPKKFKKEIESKIQVIPNGIDPFWFKNKGDIKQLIDSKTVRLLYCGEFSKNKNIKRVIDAVKLLRQEGYEASLSLVGNYGSYKDDINHYVKQLKTGYQIHDKVNDLNALKQHYRNADIFIMPSHTETFGLVYIEALSQGLPIIYTKGQGVDGYFDNDSVGISVVSNDVQHIKHAIINVIKNYDQYSEYLFKYLDIFSWNKIAKQYQVIYR
ncbi:hypothetical protein DID74_00225 [Candidatus Marinamargulisbacteria bacterium SCGC AG-333-B06]|nr:hypothetical protein DID74_00225 [Candidatus Marinamargulisbacteria bacterium SCGC AG-333-B06]